MKIIMVGATGTMGTYLSSAFENENEIIRASSKGGDFYEDTTSKPVSLMYMSINQTKYT